MRYKVITTSNAKRLEGQMNDLNKQGYRLAEFRFVSSSPGGRIYVVIMSNNDEGI